MSGQTGHILVVEDDPIHRKVVKLHLTRAGFKVATATNSVNALLLAQLNQFDLVISDYHLPDYVGTDFIKLLRSRKEHAATPVILLTARADELNVPRLRDKLSALVLSKPCSMSRLVDMVSKCLQIARSSSDPADEETQSGPSNAELHAQP